MPHLGTQIAALVDDQLPSDQLDAALAHLDRCELCRAGVRAQRLAKTQMETLRAVQPSDELLASLFAIGARRSTHSPVGRTTGRATRVILAGGLTVAAVSVASLVVTPHASEGGPTPTRVSGPPGGTATATPIGVTQRSQSGPATLPMAGLAAFTR